jgi:hypothetical protein
MQAFPIIQQSGPLPITVQFKAPLDGPALLVVTGSLWTTSANNMMQLNVIFDAQQVGTGQLFSNGNSTHRALPTVFANIKVSYGKVHTLELTGSGTSVVSDINDPFYAALLF